MLWATAQMNLNIKSVLVACLEDCKREIKTQSQPVVFAPLSILKAPITVPMFVPTCIIHKESPGISALDFGPDAHVVLLMNIGMDQWVLHAYLGDHSASC